MLNAYVKRPLTRERYRSRPAGPHLDAFILWLEQRGYHPRRILRLIRGAHLWFPNTPSKRGEPRSQYPVRPHPV